MRGHLTAPRLLAMFLGANLGWTVTIQLLTFRLQNYAGLFIIAGVIGFQFLSRGEVDFDENYLW